MRRPHASPVTAVLAVAFAALAAGAWGSTTGPGTTGNGGNDPAGGSSDPVEQVQIAPLADPSRQTVVTSPPARAGGGGSFSVPEPGDDEDEGGSGHRGRGLGVRYCQDLKGKGGPAFGHCIAATAHRLRGGGPGAHAHKAHGKGAPHATP